MSDAQTVSPEFRWLERGDGEPVVFLHGLMGHMDHWEPTLEALDRVSRQIRDTTLDLRMVPVDVATVVLLILAVAPAAASPRRNSSSPPDFS